jgi:poly(ADP-ribose) glycohydrolase
MFKECILSYNPQFESKWDFSSFHNVFATVELTLRLLPVTIQVFDKGTSKAFFENTLPKIVRLALELPTVCKVALPLLLQRDNFAITLSQHQVCFQEHR